MVAFTPAFDLPYAEGSDPPCFGPGTGCDNLESVWCDFAALVEDQLDAVDLVLGRTATAIPMAQISVTSETGIDPAAGAIPFDTVEFDTDNMTRTILGQLVIEPRRDGIYRIDTEIMCGGSYGAVFSLMDALIEIGGVSFLDQPIALTITPGGAAFGIRASALWSFNPATPVPRALTVEANFTSPAGVVYTDARLSVHWHSDL